MSTDRREKSRRSKAARGTRTTAASAGGNARLKRPGTVIRPVLAAIAGAAARLDRLFLTVTRGFMRPLSRATIALAEAITPRRVAYLTLALAFAALVTTQFMNLRGVEIGQADYVGLSAIADAPTTALQTAWNIHGPLILILAGGALGILSIGLIPRQGRSSGPSRPRHAYGLLAILGLAATIALALIIDLPGSGRAEEFGGAYADAKNILLPGFAAQCAALLTLLLTSAFIALPSVSTHGRKAEG